ncbi:MAG: hypothetical protein ACI9MN_000666 [Saprospiraceae bacterium]|jgi:hypothetical protein|tara:strand:- start:787 stop:1167 length:381 start_codon:yes stop_codon:yes gene_type:complete
MLLRGLLKSKDLVSNQRVYDHVVESVFRVYLLQPLALEVRLGQAAIGMQMTPAGLEFSLPALYKFAVFEVQDPDPDPDIQSYTSFRRCLYGQQTQVRLHALDAEVVIAQNHKNVNMSIYRLQTLAS